jgi:hypothetical protein
MGTHQFFLCLTRRLILPTLLSTPTMSSSSPQAVRRGRSCYATAPEIMYHEHDVRSRRWDEPSHGLFACGRKEVMVVFVHCGGFAVIMNEINV